MLVNETQAQLRRIYFLVRDTNGALTTTALTGLVASDIKTSANGLAFVNAAGTLVHVGDGLYYYQATAGDATVPGFFWVRLDRANGMFGEAWVPVGQIYTLDETTLAELRLPFTIYDTNGELINGVVGAGGLTITLSVNGGAPVAAAGTLVAVTGTTGVYYYQGVVANAAVEGLLIVYVASAISATAIAFTAVSEQGNVGATVQLANPLPASGSDLSTDRRVARYTPVSFNILVGGLPVTVGASPFCLWVKFRNDDQGHVFWDSKTGFLAPYFRRSTWVAATALMTLLPDGGWQDEIDQICVGGQSSPSIITVRAGATGSDPPPHA